MQKTKELMGLRFFVILLCMFSLFSINGCADVKEKAKSELAKKNVAFDGVSFVQSVELGDVETVRLFLKAGMDPNVKGENERTPLHAAANFDYREIAEMLIAQGADVNATNKRGTTPILLASFSGYKEMMELLLSKGADVNKKADDGISPLLISMKRGDWEIVELLIKKGADTKIKRKEDGATLLHIACSVPHCPLSMVKLLINSEVDVNTKNKVGQSAITVAKNTGNKEIAEYLIGINKGRKASK